LNKEVDKMDKKILVTQSSIPTLEEYSKEIEDI